jgi:hypothetical protein
MNVLRTNDSPEKELKLFQFFFPGDFFFRPAWNRQSSPRRRQKYSMLAAER